MTSAFRVGQWARPSQTRADENAIENSVIQCRLEIDMDSGEFDAATICDFMSEFVYYFQTVRNERTREHQHHETIQE